MVSRITAALAARYKAIQEKEKGFTLIELLIVVIIIGVLAAIAIPIYLGVQNSAKESAVQSDLSNAKVAVVAAYTADPKYKPTGLLSDSAPLSTGSTKSLGDFGMTLSGNYDDGRAPTAFTGSTGTEFCIDAQSGDTKTWFHVTGAKGVEAGKCEAIG